MENLKNKISIMISALIRGAVLSAALFAVTLLISNSGRLWTKLQSYGSFEKLKDYYGISVSPYVGTSDGDIQKLDDALVSFFRKSYGMGGRLLSAGSQILLYDKGFLEKEELELQDYVITVNEAYLREHPVVGSDGAAVAISGDPEELYFLVPERFREHGEELERFFEENDTFLRYFAADKKEYGIEKAHGQEHDTIPANLIYIRDGQEYAPINMDRGGRLKGTVRDPIVRVVNLSNVSDAQIPHYVTSRDYLVPVRSGQDLEKLNRAVDAAGLSGYVMQVNSMWDAYTDNLKNNVKAMGLQFLIAAAAIGISCRKWKLIALGYSRGMAGWIISWGLAFGAAGLLLGGVSRPLIAGLLVMGVADFIWCRRRVEKEYKPA